ncbi:MAG TPA: hypothetical protein VKS60_17180 [Stellaceae bacterium]|nr:hypothetical protein [Stellaceae bacterium]
MERGRLGAYTAIDFQDDDQTGEAIWTEAVRSRLDAGSDLRLRARPVLFAAGRCGGRLVVVGNVRIHSGVMALHLRLLLFANGVAVIADSRIPLRITLVLAGIARLIMRGLRGPVRPVLVPPALAAR